jgi:hypothetical protein
MKKSIIGFSIATLLLLSGCEDTPFPNQPTSVAQMIKEQKVVGWTDYKTDRDRDGVADYKDKCPNTKIGVKVDTNGCAIDNDHDGVADYKDKCPNTPKGLKVDSYGCVLDIDEDGVPDYKDKCPNTIRGSKVDKFGCSIDSDGDSVVDGVDICPNTPKGASVNSNGCAVDGDADGVIDLFDKCPNTKIGVKVDTNGCAIDSDHDGVNDYMDKCPNTPRNVKVNFEGCPVLHIFRFNFKVNSSNIDKKYYPEIEKLAKILKNNRKLHIKIQGFTDSTGSKSYNKLLSLKRANALRKILVYKYKINPRRIRVYGFGDSHPIAPNNTKEGRRLNRRIVVVSR